MTRFFSRAFGPRAASDDGFSMVEMMVSLLIIAIVSAASVTFFVDNIRGVNSQRQHQTAVYLGDQQLEAVQSLPVAKLVTGRTLAQVTALYASPAATAMNIAAQDDTTNPANYDATAIGATCAISHCVVPITGPATGTGGTAVTVNNVPYSLTTFIDVCWYSNVTGFCTPNKTAITTQEYRVSVYVTWQSGGTCVNGCNYQTSTLIDPSSDPLFNTNISFPAANLTTPASGTVFNDNDASTCTTNGNTYPGTLFKFTGGTNLKANIRVLISTGGGQIPSASIYQPTGAEVDFCLQTYDMPGPYTLSVINTDGGHFQTGITEVANLTGASGWTPASPNLTLTGGGFEAGAMFSATGASWGTVSNLVTGNSVSNGNPTDDSVTLNNFVGPTNGATAVISLTNPDFSGTSTTTPPGTNPPWTITAPQVTGLSRAAIVAGQTLTVNVTGTGFQPGFTPVVTNATMVATYLSPTSLQLAMTGLVAGTPATVNIANPDGGTSGLFSFNVDPPPVVVTATPNYVIAGQSRTVTLTGTGFVSGMTVTQSNGTALTVTALTPTSMTLAITASAVGSDAITLTNPDGGTTSFSLAVHAPPVIASVAPNPFPVNTATTLTLTGTGFVSGLTVAAAHGTFTLGTVTSTSITLVGFTSASTGPDAITVTNPDGGVTTYNVTVNPIISGISPNPVITNKATTVTITGQGFASGLTVAAARGTFTLGAVTATSITLTNMTVTTAGADVLTVTNPDGSSAAVSLTVDAAPTISSVTGNPIAVNVTRNLTIVGTGFAAGATVSIARGTYTVGAVGGGGTTIAINNFNVTSLGSDLVTVTNPDGGQATFSLTIDSPPTITAITPVTAKHSTATTYTLTGTGFAAGATVTITENGVTMTAISATTVASTTSLSFSAKPTATPTSGSVTVVVTVTNTDGGVSTAFTKTMTAS